jgi:hypothetical protein
MLTPPELDKVAKRLPEYPLTAISIVVEILTYYLQFHKNIKTVPTIKDLAVDLPFTIQYIYGSQLSDLLLCKNKINRYSDIKKILDTLVKEKFFKYSPNDNINDLDIQSDLVFDVKTKNTQSVNAYLKEKFSWPPSL